MPRKTTRGSVSSDATLPVLFGRRLRLVRKSKGLTQESLALESGVDVSFIGMVERGKKAPGLRVVEKLAAALGILPVELFQFNDVCDAGDAERRLREMFSMLLHDAGARDMLSFALENALHYRIGKKNS